MIMIMIKIIIIIKMIIIMNMGILINTTGKKGAQLITRMA